MRKGGRGGKARPAHIMKFAEVRPGELFEVTNEPGALFYKIPEPQGFLPCGCRGCGEQRIWNARCVENDHLVHFCPGEEVFPVEQETVELISCSWPEGGQRGGF